MKTFGFRIAAALLLSAGLWAQDADLARGFRTPPDSAKPWTYWFWINGNLTREGITADLEAMQRVGVRGVVIMEVDVSIPAGPVPFLSPKWREMFQHVMKEADRLGIEVNMNNDGGWCGSGGPWITPELSMQVVVWSETRASGSRRFDAVLPRPKVTSGFYRDIAVLAFPTPPAEDRPMAEASPKFTYGAERHPLAAEKLIDGNAATTETLPAPKAGESQILDISFSQPFTAESLTLAVDTYHGTANGSLAVSDDGKTYTTVRPFAFIWPNAAVSFNRVSARYFRLTFTPPATGAPVPLSLGEVELSPSPRIEGLPSKAAYVNFGSPAFRTGGIGAPFSPSMSVAREKIQDLSARMTPDGRLAWDVPAGRWTLLRFGYTSPGKMNHPAPASSLGLECDKLSKRAVDVQFAGLMGKLLEDQRAVGAHSLHYTHIDSWETGSQNWTLGFREEFRRRRGYDLLPYLPVFTGRAVASQDISERFLWDLRRTIADMLLVNYAGHFRELSHRHGLKLSIEAYGNGPLDDLPYAGIADLPVSEFWMGMEPWWVTREMASATHAYGRPILAAEAFTARSPAGKWTNHPFRLKPLGDQMFTQGINRFIFHRYAMQPWMNRVPGMTMGPYGIHFERTNTWFEQSRAWLDYLARCQFLLQQGTFVADIAYLNSERIPNDYHQPLAMNLALPAGYDYDAIPAELLLHQMTAGEGGVALPSGMNYRVVVLPSSATMRVAQLRKIKQLVEAGAIVVGAPPLSSPSLEEYPRGDGEVLTMASEMWGPADGANVTEHRLGKGKVVWGQPLANVLADAGAPPDFGVMGAEVGKQLRYIHRRAGAKEIYFLASAEGEAATFLCSFRVTGKRPELWHPDSGRIERVAVFEEQAQQTRIPIRLEPYGAVFVIFDGAAPPASERLAGITRDGFEVSGIRAVAAQDLRSKLDGIRIETDAGRYRLEVSAPGAYRLQPASGKAVALDVPALPPPVEVTGAWQLSFPPGLGAPPQVTLDRLISWTAHPLDGVKYFSGTATYRRSVRIPPGMLGAGRGLYLDLGRVEVIAEVSLNGHDLGILWKPPFRVDITEAAREGDNDLEVRVVNLWPNRLIGDDKLPEDTERDGTKLKRWPQWFLDGKPSPTGRLTITTWKLWRKDDALLESGLLGPVTLQPTARLEAKFEPGIQ